MTARAAALACALTAWCSGAPALAQEREPMAPHVTDDAAEPASPLQGPVLHLSVGVGAGSARVFGSGLEGRGSDTNFAPQLRLAYLRPLARYLALGAAVRAVAWQSDVDEALGNGDSHFASALFAGELRAPRPSGGAFYLRAALGPAFGVLSTDVPFEEFREDADLGIGLEVDLSGGTHVVVERYSALCFGLTLDIVQLWHELHVEPLDGDVTRYHARYSLVSFGIEGGIVFAL